MMTIHRFPLTFGRNLVKMDTNAEFLSVGEKDRSLNIWMLLNDQSPLMERCFDVYATGEEIPEPECALYRGTVITEGHGQEFVWHIFERLAI